jgi:hypothetical protein
MLTALVLVVLAGLWAVVLVPPALRAASRLTRSADSIGSFNQKMSVLGGDRTTLDLTGPRPVAARTAAGPPASRAAVRKRRRDVLVGLLAANGFTLLLALVAGGTMWLLWLLAAGLLGGYVTLLVQIRKAAAEREMKVAFLPHAPTEPELANVRPLRRVGS